MIDWKCIIYCNDMEIVLVKIAKSHNLFPDDESRDFLSFSAHFYARYQIDCIRSSRKLGTTAFTFPCLSQTADTRLSNSVYCFTNHPITTILEKHWKKKKVSHG